MPRSVSGMGLGLDYAASKGVDMRLMALVLGILLLSGGIWLLATKRRKAKNDPRTPATARHASTRLESPQRLVPDEAEANYRQALASNPNAPGVLNRLGALLYERGSVDEAEACFRQALNANADFTEAYYRLGVLLETTGRLDEAVAALRQVTLTAPDFPEGFRHLAQLLAQTGQLADAEAAYREAIRLKPDFAEAFAGLADLLKETRRGQDAEGAWREVIRLRPDRPEPYNNLGVLLREAGRFSEAEAVFHQALAANAHFPEALCNFGMLLDETGRLGEAEAAYRQALAIMPDFPNGWINLGSLLDHMGRVEEAEAAYREALGLEPNHLMALSYLGALLQNSGRFDAAEAIYEKVFQIDPFFPFARIYRAYLNLLRGNFAQGFADHEYRWESTFQKFRPSFPQPLWDGKPFPGQTLLVHWEQGLGDNIQMFRYLRRLATLGGQVLFEAPLPLLRLFNANAPECVTILGEGQALPAFDQHCPIFSLPLLCNTLLDSIPPAAPFLKAPEDTIAASPKIPGTGLKVGVVWAGNATHKNDRNRSMDLALLEPLFAVPRILWVILQKERRPEGFADLAQKRGWWDPMGGVSDLADTAAIIDQLDLVIGVDTSVMHLAGAMGKPAWLLLPHVPDWRWLLGRDDSPWYPTMRLFRQTAPGQWQALIQQLADALSAFENASR